MSDDHELSAIDPGFDVNELHTAAAPAAMTSFAAEGDAADTLPASAVLEACRRMSAVSWARLAPGGIVLDANRGFAELFGLKATFGAEVASRFIAPRLTELEGLARYPFQGQLTLLGDGERRLAMTATVHRIGRQLLVIGERAAPRAQAAAPSRRELAAVPE